MTPWLLPTAAVAAALAYTIKFRRDRDRAEQKWAGQNRRLEQLQRERDSAVARAELAEQHVEFLCRRLELRQAAHTESN